MAAVLTDVDGTAAVVAALLGSVDVLALIGNDPTRITGSLVAPYPRLRVEASSSSYDLRNGISTHDVRVSAYGMREGDPGDAALMHMLGVVLGVIRGLEYVTYGPGQPVVSYVEQSLPMQPLPEPSGRTRWQVGVRLHMHPSAVSLPA